MTSLVDVSERWVEFGDGGDILGGFGGGLKRVGWMVRC